MKCIQMYLEKFGKMFQVAPNGMFEEMLPKCIKMVT
jgi:hypothetical protein